ncbi:uncharacterized protein K489DRAFT_381857 [Dissoconium aciculare CBS 342.82]|uniref:F-box domain-containing protein n=1 Tax=Dissoconium aciculare CBS 342.82 TaxID=1314786 RepID=A0A6J3M1S4_9PEZI|nr:uncharacterized protein K489DRAFT_381857 [Dissoconium aciculare CBS 342.82]KAF1821853.1 hypothetical protein K489DRAFT_381857 [Dissoconium aciculare CBS 342.82]
MAGTVPCPLLALPAELRIRIYEASLAPTGCLHLTSSATCRKAVVPRVSPPLLAACRQVYDEAKHLLYTKNSTCVVVDAGALDAPLIAESRLPQSVLQRLRRVCLVLDCTATYRAPFTELDLDVLRAFTSIEELRIAVVLRTDPDAASAAMRDMLGILLALILERIPARVRIEYGVAAGSDEEEVANELKVRRQKTFRREQRVTVVVVDGSELKGRADESAPEQGSNLREMDDVFAEYRVR